MVEKPQVDDDEIQQLDEVLPFGWILYEINDEHHLIPIKDSRLHKPSASCWCNPVEVDVDCYEHNAEDGRDDYESGERKYN